ncbi:MAG TPA: ABC transporter permease [Bryobacteraceae bacterium]|nr:ABC transporter permease [Bryobacteraceae bacterium]
MNANRRLHPYLMEAWYESLRMLRSPSFAVPFLLIPVLVYLLMGVVFFGDALAKDPAAAMGAFAGLTVFGMMGPGMFGFGVAVALERDQGLLQLKRALPMPRPAYFVAKMTMALVFNTIIMATMIAAALFAAHLRLGAAQILGFAAVNIVGALPFCAIGLFIGVWVSGPSAAGFVNLAYLPMMWFSGLFIPLPKSLQGAAPIWPAYHLLQLALGALGQRSSGSAWTHAGFLALLTVLLSAIAVRRLARAG